MTSTLFACYKAPESPEDFKRHYEGTHTELALALPGLRTFTGSWPEHGPAGSEPPYHLIAALAFDDRAALDAALGSPEGRAAVADLANFASAGVDLMIGPTTSYL